MKLQMSQRQKKYPRFIYEKYSYKISGGNLEIFFDFKIPPDLKFKPKIVIEKTGLPAGALAKAGNGVLDNLIFNLGLAEIPSYWKATCSPEIIIKAGVLDSLQIKWWKDLIMNGMGQFFYENKINSGTKKSDFVKIENANNTAANNSANRLSKNPTIVGFFDSRFLSQKNTQKNNKINEVLIPIGGGKDSIVTLELLKQNKIDVQCFSLNPTDAARKIMEIAGCKNPIIIRREIDKKLLELNRKGYLNGHTPFSSYLAFLGVLVAAISGRKYIVLSNERSSNEGNIKYLGKNINHQWSKSFEFEEKFRNYSKKYLVKNLEYFSFLRPLYEIQIAKLFSKYPKYFFAFLSCNEAYKTDSGIKKPTKKWCGECSKCLFAFVILYPFIKEKELIKIFGKNLLEDKKLLPTMQQLIGERGFKPFECVGTKKESLAAFYFALRSFMRRRVELPVLLKYFENKILPKYPSLEKEAKTLLNSWNIQNNIPKKFKMISKIKNP